MPYIETKTRLYFDDNPHDAKTPGDLTYVIYKVIYELWKTEPRFKTFFELQRGQRMPVMLPEAVQYLMKALIKTGALQPDVFAAYDCALLELWTRHVADYEKQKMEENGDVAVEVAQDAK